MKSQLKFLLLLALTISLIGCSNSNETEDSNTKESEILTTVQEVIPKEFNFTKEQLSLVEEQLFFYLRKQILDVDENTFVKYEELRIKNEQFEYSAVVIEMDLLKQFTLNSRKPSSIFQFASYSQEMLILDLGDTVNVIGSINFDQTNQIVSEQPLSEVSIIIKATIHTSSLRSSPYAYSGYERATYDFDFEEPLIVSLNHPRIYSKDELYLKARIKALTKTDLEGFNSDELSYLRNEIFARHGHAFKTDKMKSYFNQKDWYNAIYGDAGSFLNNLEKKNVTFIKTLEG